MDHGWLSQRRREATAVYDPMTLSPSSRTSSAPPHRLRYSPTEHEQRMSAPT
jgi:hypothetical protein